MPIYVHKCRNGHKFDVIRKVADYNLPSVCECGAPARRILTTTMVAPDMQESYISPATGKHITSYKQRRDDMERSGCVDYEPSLRQESTNKMNKGEAALEKKMDASVEAAIHAMPIRKREKLEKELNSGANIKYSRH